MSRREPNLSEYQQALGVPPGMGHLTEEHRHLWEELFRRHPAMMVFPEEREWALAIKQAAAEDPELLPLSDLEYYQYAVVTQGNVAKSLQRMRGMQLFRQEYGINDTIEQANELIHALLVQQPGLLLSVDKAKTSPQQQDQMATVDAAQRMLADLQSHYLMVFDFAKINPKNVRLPKDKRDLLGALYYLHQSTQVSPRSIRNGILFIAECDGMSFENVSLDFVGPIWRELKLHYPVILKEISWLRAATAATVMYGLCKHFLPQEVQNKVNLGCEFEAFDGRLDELFLTHRTQEENNLWILQRAETNLRERDRTARLLLLA